MKAIYGTLILSTIPSDYSPRDIWRSDGTGGGTHLVLDPAPDTLSIPPVAVGNNAFFVTNGPSGIDRLWVMPLSTLGLTIRHAYLPLVGR